MQEIVVGLPQRIYTINFTVYKFRIQVSIEPCLFNYFYNYRIYWVISSYIYGIDRNPLAI